MKLRNFLGLFVFATALLMSCANKEEEKALPLMQGFAVDAYGNETEFTSGTELYNRTLLKFVVNPPKGKYGSRPSYIMVNDDPKIGNVVEGKGVTEKGYIATEEFLPVEFGSDILVAKGLKDTVTGNSTFTMLKSGDKVEKRAKLFLSAIVPDGKTIDNSPTGGWQRNDVRYGPMGVKLSGMWGTSPLWEWADTIHAKQTFGVVLKDSAGTKYATLNYSSGSNGKVGSSNQRVSGAKLALGDGIALYIQPDEGYALDTVSNSKCTTGGASYVVASADLGTEINCEFTFRKKNTYTVEFNESVAGLEKLVAMVYPKKGKPKIIKSGETVTEGDDVVFYGSGKDGQFIATKPQANGITLSNYSSVAAFLTAGEIYAQNGTITVTDPTFSASAGVKYLPVTITADEAEAILKQRVITDQKIPATTGAGGVTMRVVPKEGYQVSSYQFTGTGVINGAEREVTSNTFNVKFDASTKANDGWNLIINFEKAKKHKVFYSVNEDKPVF